MDCHNISVTQLCFRNSLDQLNSHSSVQPSTVTDLLVLPRPANPTQPADGVEVWILRHGEREDEAPGLSLTDLSYPLAE